ncbi:MAG: M16 family metallopeptidase [Methanosarcinales archaeon]
MGKIVSSTACKKTVLDSGLRIITVERPCTKTLATRVYIKVGSRYDGHFLGLSHFLEHILFQGSKNYSKKDIYGIVEGFGGKINALTTQEYMCINLVVIYKYFDQCLDVLADIIINPNIDESDIASEKLVVAEEIKRELDTEHIVFDAFSHAIWLRHLLRNPILGNLTDVNKIQLEHVKAHYHKYFTPDNTVIAIAGNFKYDSIIPKIKNKFKNYNKPYEGNKISFPKNIHEPPILEKREVFMPMDIHQTHLVLGWHGVGMNHKDKHALKLLDRILGTGGSSRLYQRIREKEKLVYNIHSTSFNYEEVGYIAIYAATDPNKVEFVIKSILQEIEKLQKEPVSNAELASTKTALEGSLTLNFETNYRLAGIYGIEELLHHIEPFDKYLDKIKKVTKEDIQRVANKYFNIDNYVCIQVGRSNKGINFK